MAGDSSSVEVAPKGRTAVAERGERTERGQEQTERAEPKVSESRTRIHEPVIDTTPASDSSEKPKMTDEEKAKEKSLLKVLGMGIKELTALFNFEDKSGKAGTFQGDVLWFMAGMQRNPVREWDTETLHEQILRFEGHVEDPLYGGIASQVLDLIDVAVREKCKTAKDPLTVRRQVYRGEKQELPPVRVESVDHGRVRAEMRAEESDIRALARERERDQRRKFEELEAQAKLINDKEKREKELRDLHRASELVGGIEGTEFVADRSAEDNRALALSQARNDGGYGRVVGEFGAFEEPGEFAGDDGDDYYEEKEKLLREGKSWEEYGWSREQRDVVRDLITSTRIETKNAENLMAAMVLHGMAASEVLSILTAKDEQGYSQVSGQLDRILKGKNILKNDDEVMDIIFTNPDDKTNFITNIMYYEPQTFEDTVFQIAFESRTNTIFNRRGAMAVLANRVNRRKRGDGTTQFDFWEKVNADAVFKWFFASAMEAHGNHTTSALDFEQQVQVKKGAASVPITVYEMMLGRLGSMFRSKYGNKDRNGWVADDLEALSVILSETRNSGIEKQQRMGDVKQLEELAYKELVNSNMTRDVGGLSLLQLMTMISEIGNRTDKGDGKVGAMILTTYGAYCNINNLEGMAETLGLTGLDQLADVFNLNNFIAARDGALRGRREHPALKNTGIPNPDEKVFRNGKWVSKANEWLDFTEDGIIEMDEHTRDGVKHNKVKIKDLFDADGKAKLGNGPRKSGESNEAYKKRCLKERESFIKFVNFLTHVTPDARLETVIRGVIQKQAAKLHGIRDTKDGVSIPGQSDYAEMVAHGMLYRFGMYFHLDNSMSGRTEEAKRNARYLGDRVRKDAHAGNLFLLGVLPHWLLPEALVVSTTSIDPNTGKPMNMQNALMDIQRVRVKMDLEINERVEREMKKDEWQRQLTQKIEKIGNRETAEAELRADIRDYLFQHDDDTQKALKDYNSATSQLKFKEGAERNYLQDHWQKGMGMDERLTGAHGFDFNDYIQHDAVSGPTVKAEKLVKDLAKFFNQMRKFQVGTDWYYGTPIPTWNEKTQTMEMRPLGESVIGRQVIRQIMETNPKKFRNPDGTPNWKAINEHGDVAKWMEAAFVAAQVLQFTERAHWNLNPRYSYALRESILEVMEHLPGEFNVNPEDMRAGAAHKNYFSHEMMKWIRKTSGTGYLKSFVLEAAANILLGSPGKKDGLFSGLSDLWNIFAKATLQGVGA